MKIFILWYRRETCACGGGDREEFEAVFKTSAEAHSYAEKDGVDDYYVDEEVI